MANIPQKADDALRYTGPHGEPLKVNWEAIAKELQAKLAAAESTRDAAITEALQEVKMALCDRLEEREPHINAWREQIIITAQVCDRFIFKAPKMTTYTQAELNAAIVETVRKCERLPTPEYNWPTETGEHHAGWERGIMAYREAIRLQLPADILASVERREQAIRDEVNHLHAQSHDAIEADFARDRQRLQLEARIAEQQEHASCDYIMGGPHASYCRKCSRIAALEAELNKLK